MENDRRQSHAKVINYLTASKRNQNDSRTDINNSLKDDSISSIKSVNSSSTDVNKAPFSLTPLINSVSSPRQSADIVRSKFRIENQGNIESPVQHSSKIIKQTEDQKTVIKSINKVINNSSTSSVTSLISDGSPTKANSKQSSNQNISNVFSMFKGSSLLNSGINTSASVNLVSKQINNDNPNSKAKDNKEISNYFSNNSNKNDDNTPGNKRNLNISNTARIDSGKSRPEISKVISQRGKASIDVPNSPMKFNNLFQSDLISNSGFNLNSKAPKSTSNKNMINLNENQFSNMNISNSKETSTLSQYDEKLNSNTASSVREYGYAEDKNPKFRPQMEDFSKIVDNYIDNKYNGFFSLYDGHGGVDTVKFAKEKMPDVLSKCLNQSNSIETALTNAFNRVDEQLKFCDSENTGATAIVVYKTRDYLYCANVGDSKCFLLSDDMECTQLTYDHKCSDITEVERIKKSGGIVFSGRVFGQLVLTRALGDHALKEYGVISDPHIATIKLESKHKYVIMASDGVWDIIQKDDIIKIYKQNTNISALEFAKILVKTSVENGSKDNVSCIVLKLN